MKAQQVDRGFDLSMPSVGLSYNPLNQSKLYYLASPFSSKLPEVEDERFKTITKVAAELLKVGIKGIYPITSSVEIGKYMEAKTTFEHWAELDFMYIEHCDHVIVADMLGWQESIGVQAEIEFAHKLGKKVFLLNHTRLLQEHIIDGKEI